MTRTMTNALTTHEALRRLGFAPEEIFVSLSGGIMFVIAKRGGKEMAAAVGRQAGTQDEWIAEWDVATVLWTRVMTEAQVRELYDQSEIKTRGVELLLALARKGFDVRSLNATPRQQATSAN